MAEIRPDTLDAIAELRDACDFTGCTDLGGMVAGTLQVRADLVTLTLEGLSDDRPENRTYVGEIPDELASLYERTLDAATEVEEASQAFTSCSSSCDGGELTALLTAADELEDVLNAWDPYL